MKRRFFILLLSLALFSFKSDKLPQVLIIGDSISIGYTSFVKKALEGQANVVHNPGNAQHTGTGLEKLDEWLGDTQWDVIHFNWGLWDLCYRSQQSSVYGNRDKFNGKVTFSLAEYQKNMEDLVIRLKMTGAKLIFATTSYVPEGEAGRVVNDDKHYNKVALRIMKKYQIEVNDINALSKRVHKKYKKADGDVHYTPEGYGLISKPVVKRILKNL